VGSECSVGIPKGAESKINGENSTLGLVAVEAEGAAENPGTRGNGGNRNEIQNMTPTHKIEDKSLFLLQVNCRSIYNKSLEFWNLVDMYNPEIIIGTESWFREDIGNAELFRADYTTFRRDRQARSGWGGGGLSVLKIILPARSYGLTMTSRY